ncbi:hypothetical protein AB0G04_34390 [Actinoplanes sp. NPDC023801]|uniref:DUF6892 domain-containing protein n=1 Tax=Actinoplanes sp. NPDC023801 TaxID=3154595 RepID=UPI00340D8C9F
MTMIWKYWDGESDEFCIRSFDGIAEALPNLRKLAVDMYTGSDLTPLAGCTDLHTLHLYGGFSVTDLGPLASLTALRDLRLGHCVTCRPCGNSPACRPSTAPASPSRCAPRSTTPASWKRSRPAA